MISWGRGLVGNCDRYGGGSYIIVVGGVGVEKNQWSINRKTIVKLPVKGKGPSPSSCDCKVRFNSGERNTKM